MVHFCLQGSNGSSLWRGDLQVSFKNINILLTVSLKVGDVVDELPNEDRCLVRNPRSVDS